MKQGFNDSVMFLSQFREIVFPVHWTVFVFSLLFSSAKSKSLYQARESSLVPLRLLTVHFLQKKSRFMKPLLLPSIDTFVHLPKIQSV